MTISRRTLLLTGTAGLALARAMPGWAQSPSAADIGSIGKEAYVYGFPMVDAYRIMWAYFVDTTGKQYKAPWNTLYNEAQVYTPADTAVQTPNSDTPYSFVGLDLRAEPMVITVPEIEASRYFSIQFIDAYTYNFDYVGSRTTGNGGGSFMIAGPDWTGETPAGISKVMQSDTQIALALFRTQLLGADDLPNVQSIQAKYKAEPLSSFLGQTPPPAAPAIDFITPIAAADEVTSTQFFNILNFLLQFAPTVDEEKDLRASFASIGIDAGKTIDFAALSADETAAWTKAMSDAWADYDNLLKTEIATGKVTAANLFGTRQDLSGNYLYRMAAAKLGIFGNTAAEAMYPLYSVDSDGNKLTGANKYTLHFAADAMPPVNAFWSVTMYELPQSLLVTNPINRYLINSPMLPQLTKDADGGITIYIQNESPGADKEANWLPAPAGDFQMFMRLYWPKEEALNGTWKVPPVQIVK
jgi:hypothetical protein